MTTPVPPVSRRMERGILGLFVAAAVVAGVGLAVPAIRQIVAIAADRTPVQLLTDAPVPIDAAAGGPGILSASYESAAVVASGLDATTRLLLAAGTAFGALTLAATVGAVVYFLLLMMWRRPLHRSLVRASQIAGGALMLGGLLSAGLGGLGTMMAADAINPSADDQFLVGSTFDPAVFFAGLTVLALSLVFDRAAKAQRDTEGLV